MSATRSRLERLAARREELQSRSAVLRGELAAQAGVSLRAPLALADNIAIGWRWMQQNPEWPIGLAGLLLLARPRLLLRWGGRGLWVWQAWRRLRPYAGAAWRTMIDR